MYKFTYDIRTIGCQYGAHARTKGLKETATKYTVQAVTYMVFDQILWFKKTVDKLKEK